MSQSSFAVHQPNLGRGFTICLTGTVIWAFTAIFIRHLTEAYAMPPLVLAFWRDVFVALGMSAALGVAARTALRPRQGSLRFLVSYGLVLAVFNTLWTFSVALNGAAVATVLVYSSPAYTALLEQRLFGEPLNRLKLAALAASFVGCLLVAGAYQPAAWQVNPLGIVIGILSGLGFAAYSLMGKFAAQRQINSWTALLYTFAFAAVFLLGAIYAAGAFPALEAPAELFWLGDSLSGWGWLIVLALVPTIGGFGLYTRSLRDLPAGTANLIATLEPVVTGVLAYLFLGESLQPPQLLGSALILGGILLLRQKGTQAVAAGAHGAG